MEIQNSPETVESRTGDCENGTDHSLEEFIRMTDLCRSRIKSSSELLAEMRSFFSGHHTLQTIPTAELKELARRVYPSGSEFTPRAESAGAATPEPSLR
jgi:hypothetical protein